MRFCVPVGWHHGDKNLVKRRNAAHSPENECVASPPPKICVANCRTVPHCTCTVTRALWRHLVTETARARVAPFCAETQSLWCSMRQKLVKRPMRKCHRKGGDNDIYLLFSWWCARNFVVGTRHGTPFFLASKPTEIEETGQQLPQPIILRVQVWALCHLLLCAVPHIAEHTVSCN